MIELPYDLILDCKSKVFKLECKEKSQRIKKIHIKKYYIYKNYIYLRSEFKPTIIKAEFYARGKVLLSGEYFVVHGATSLALPTKLGQKMKIQELSGSEVIWNSFDNKGKKWFEAEIDLMGLDVVKSSDEQIGKYLKKLFKACCQNNSEFLSHWKKYKVDHYLEFPREWGLGSSSTLIYNMSGWADINPYHLYFDIADGSGYDVACAGADGPILYTLGDGSLNVEEVEVNYPFKDQLYFVPLGNKVSSNDAVKLAKKKNPDKKLIDKITHLSEKALELKTLKSLETWIKEHEDLVSSFIGMPRVKESNFSDYWGEIKSLGAWGGDMVLVTSEKPESEVAAYFEAKGYPTLLKYKDLIYK